MPYGQGLIKGASGGAMAGAGVGFLLGGGVGAGIGAGIGALGGLIGSWGEQSPEEIRQERLARLKAMIQQSRTNAIARASGLIKTGRENLSSNIGGMQANVLASAKRRAIAAGRPDEVAAYAAAPTEAFATQGSQATKEYNLNAAQQIEALNQGFDQADLNAEAGFADRPIEPNVSDILLNLGSSAADIAMKSQLVDAYKAHTGVASPASVTPVSPSSVSVVPTQSPLVSAPVVSGLPAIQDNSLGWNPYGIQRKTPVMPWNQSPVFQTNDPYKNLFSFGR